MHVVGPGLTGTQPPLFCQSRSFSCSWSPELPRNCALTPGRSTPLQGFSLSVLGITLFLLCFGFHLFSKLETCLFVGLGEGALSGKMSHAQWK